MSDSFIGRLLVASPSLVDPNFRRTVVLICAHDDSGITGVVLNRPLEADLVDHLPEWRHRATSPPVVFEGGPVQREVVIGLGRSRARGESAGWSEVLGEVGLFDLSLHPEDVGDDLVAIRVFSGYAGWGVEQLEAEIAEGAWFVVDAEPDDPFAREPGRLWRDVLRRQTERLAIFADFPPDPSMN